jgi:cytochrome c oxidase cbb3-type subunit 3
MPTKIEKDDVTGRSTTGHEFDGIKELDTPMPTWWLWTFYATIVWGIGYALAYPALPHVAGLLGWSSRTEVAGRLAQQQAVRAPFVARIEKASLDEVRRDADLMNFALTGGRIAFAENCAPCHGAGGAGRRGYPGLADDNWLWGGSLEAIHRTILHGIRSADPDTRFSQMPRFGADALMTSAEISDVADYVLTLSGGAGGETARRGAAVYVEKCVACHGEKGDGNRELGAPRLNGRIWQWGGDRANVVESIWGARAGAMPAWQGRLDPATMKMLALYVHALGGGE